MSFPKWLYHAERNETVFCRSPEMRRSLGEGWRQCPPPGEAKPAPAVEPVKVEAPKQEEPKPAPVEPVAEAQPKAKKKKKLWSKA